jgi:hypothetical protein
MLKALLFTLAASQSHSSAQAKMVFPLGCLTGVSSMKFPSGVMLVSSWNSRRAASSGASS